MQTIDLNGATLFKYVAGEPYHLHSVRNNYFFFARVKQVNDPEDCRVNPSLDLQGTSLQDILDFLMRFSTPIEEAKSIANLLVNDAQVAIEFAQKYERDNEIDDSRFRNTIKILCLTHKPDSFHMWSNYAKRLAPLDGFCLGYSCPPAPPKQIVQVHKCFNVPLQPDQVEVAGFRPDFWVAGEVFYGDSPGPTYNPFKSNVDDLTNSYYYKKQKWQLEEEYRCVLSDEMTFNAKNQIFNYPKDILRTVIFGEACPVTAKREMKDAVRSTGNGHIKYYTARIQTGNTIEIVPNDGS